MCVCMLYDVESFPLSSGCALNKGVAQRNDFYNTKWKTLGELLEGRECDDCRQMRVLIAMIFFTYKGLA